MSDCLILAHSQGRYLADNLLDDSIDVIYESGADFHRLRQLVPTDVNKYKVILVLGGINDLIHGWNDKTVLKRYQLLYERIRKSNQDAEIGISSILPRLPNRWKGARPTKEELSYLKVLNDQSFIINWRLSEICALTPKLTFVPPRQFTDACGYLMAKDGLHLNRQGNIVLARWFKNVCDFLKLDTFASKTVVPMQSVAVPLSAEPVLQSVAVPMSDEPVLQSVAVPLSAEPVLQSVAVPMSAKSVLQSVAAPISDESVLQSVAVPLSVDEPALQSVDEPVLRSVDEPVLQSDAIPISAESVLQSVTVPLSVDEPVLQSVHEPVLRSVDEHILQSVDEPVLQSVAHPMSAESVFAVCCSSDI